MTVGEHNIFNYTAYISISAYSITYVNLDLKTNDHFCVKSNYVDGLC